MSTNNYILNLLNIKDNNIHIYEKIDEKVIKGTNYKIIEGILTYNPKYCPCWGVINESTNDIIKWGFRKNCIVKIPKISNVEEFMLKQSEKDISNRLDISVSKIDRKLNDFSPHTVLKHSILPYSKNLNVKLMVIFLENT